MKFRALLGMILAVGLATSATAQLYVGFAVNDFSTSSNPNGQWSYGQTATVGGTFTLFTGQQVFETGQLEGWGGGLFPFVMGNLTGGIVTHGTTSYPPGLLAMHPDDNGNYAVLRWTAPSTDTYTFVTGFADIPNDDPATVDVHVLLNSSTSLFTSSLNGGTTSDTFTSSPLSLNAGDTIDLVIGNGGNGYINDHTAVTAIAYATVPEPATTALLTAGLAGVAVWWRRRNRPGCAA